MTATLAHQIVWVAAAPLWKGALQRSQDVRRPTILGFGHDGFMDELLGTLASDKPEKIADRVATGPSRSYRERLPGEGFDVQPTVKNGKLKLYQPVHGWFYLVTGSLVCQLPGLPDHPVDLGAGESAGFVLRRIAGKQELALIANGAGKKSWQPAKKTEALADGEEVLPMFPVGFREADRRRKLLAGLIPTGNQDFFLAAPIGDGTPPVEGGQPPAADAFEGVKAHVINAIAALQPPNPPPLVAPPTPPPDQQTELSKFVLMDLADFLTFYLPDVMQAVKDGGNRAGKAQALLTLLRGSAVDPPVDGKSFADLLKTILAVPLGALFDHNLAHSTIDTEDLQAKLKAALEEATPGSTMVTIDKQKPGGTTFVARLIYRRPHCGPLHPDVVSPPSEQFVMAPFFDPEAPSRPIRIALPFDPSIKGLRQFRKNVKLVLSEALKDKSKLGRKKINEKIDGPDVDCGAFSLSIPIITIVAMIILFVFISILNIIFMWIPMVKICLPSITVEPEADP